MSFESAPTSASVSRRGFLAGALAAGAAANLSVQTTRGDEPGNRKAGDSKDDGVVAIGSRRELFVDDALIARLEGDARQQLHHPVPAEICLVHDAPWEGSGSGYHSVFQDGDRYRMYYKAWHLAVSQGKVDTATHPLYCCYAESTDGLNWVKPELGLHEFRGSKENNIVLATGKLGSLNVDPGHPAVFKDENPNVADDARYKAIVRSSNPNGLLPFKSPDGLHFSPMSEGPILSGLGAFDSQNLAFWDPNIGRYRAYWRIFTERRREIRTAQSDDLIHWDPHVDLTYEDSPPEQLYTNQVKPYYRAPHLLIGFPTRYVDRGWSDSMRALPELEHRELRTSASARYGSAVTEALVMVSRDGTKFTRWNEAFLRPGPERPGSWNYGQQYLGWHVVETKSALAGGPPELSLYASESYWTGNSSEVRRYTLRLDGFVSVSAGWRGGELVTKPITFTGSELRLNFSSSAAGGLRVELQSPDGSALAGYGLDDCEDVFGDSVDRVVTWKGGADLGNLSGKPLRLRVQLKDADLFSLRFPT